MTIDTDEIAVLSRRAIVQGYRSSVTQPGELGARLYFSNRIPLTTTLRDRFPNERSIFDHLGLDQRGLWPNCPRAVRSLAADREPHEAEDDPKLFWRYWEFETEPPIARGGGTLSKVYVSPAMADLPAVFSELVRHMPGSGGRLLKMGRDVRGLLRPDKLVAYFATFHDAVAFAHRFAKAIGTPRSQGVPFTHQVGPTALVSIGVDPPGHAHSVRLAEQQSWRTWVTERLAEIILEVRASAPADFLTPIATSLVGVGVDPGTWLPTDSRWYELPERV